MLGCKRLVEDKGGAEVSAPQDEAVERADPFMRGKNGKGDGSICLTRRPLGRSTSGLMRKDQQNKCYWDYADPACYVQR